MRLQAVVSSIRERLTPPAPVAVEIAAVKAAELRIVLGEQAQVPPAQVEVWGLALSGGGIRSATYGLGVLQALARMDLLKCFHYQSTVSGGGYIGAFLQALIERRGFRETFAVLSTFLGEPAKTAASADDAVDRGPSDPARMRRPIQHLREYSNYLSPRKSPFSGDTLGMVGTYVRNVLLIQLQLCALILGLGLLPLLLYRAVIHAQAHPVATLACAGLLGIASALLLGYVTTYADRHRHAAGASKAPPLRVTVVALVSIALLAAASLIGAVGVAFRAGLPPPMERAFDALWPALTPGGRLGWASGALYFAMWMAWLLFEMRASRTHGQSPPAASTRRGRFVLASAGAAVFAGYAMVAVQALLSPGLADGQTLTAYATTVAGAAHIWHVLILGPLLTMTAVVLTGIVHLGLAGPALSDLQREIWARVGGKTAGLVAFGLVLVLAMMVYGPWLPWLLAERLGKSDWAGKLSWAGALTWVFTTGIGLFAGHGKSANGQPHGARGRLLDAVVRIAPWVFILGLIVALSIAGQALLRAFGWSDRPDDPQAYFKWLSDNVDGHGITVVVLMIGALAVWWLFGKAVNVNDFSLNAFYRNRLVRCYLGASNEARNPEPTTNFDVDDDLTLCDVIAGQRLDGSRPLFPLIGTAMNLVAAKQLDWQDRKAASFCLTPGFCGYLPPTSRAGAMPIGDLRADAGGTARRHPPPESLSQSLTLGSAIAISGAAVSPNMGYHSSPAVTFLLTLFDARLGWWLPNLAHAKRKRADSAPFFGAWLIAELLGRTHDGGKYVHLSDGGHFENLGLYELVRRGARFILCVDAGADAERAFGDLGNAVHKCRVDFGVDIRIDIDALRPQADGLAARTCAVGGIEYPDGRRGTLLYLKPSLTGEEPADIQHYARAHASFPHEPTSDQYFDEAQFECYRRLGLHAARRALLPVLERLGAEVGAPRHKSLGVHDSSLKDSLLLALHHHWANGAPDGAARFSAHGETLARLYATLRETPALSVLDVHLHRAWTDAMAGTSASGGATVAAPAQQQIRLPAAADFRVCFYFCQELIRLMESVYHDFDLERDWEHPDNRGWMNLFRHWGWTPMVRIAWAVGMPTFGARFVAFCEQRLGLPRLDNLGSHPALRADELSPPAGTDWRQHCATLAQQGIVNPIEHGILVSTALLDAPDAPPTRLFVLRVEWDAILARSGSGMPHTTLGIAVLSDKTLRLLRIQDHVRKLGLGAEFMRLLLSRGAIAAVDIRPGHYGQVGVCRRRTAREICDRLDALRQQSTRWTLAGNDARRVAAADRQMRDERRRP